MQAGELPNLGWHRSKLATVTEIQGVEAGELPDLGRQRPKLGAPTEVQGMQAGELPDPGRQRSKLGADTVDAVSFLALSEANAGSRAASAQQLLRSNSTLIFPRDGGEAATGVVCVCVSSPDWRKMER